MAAGWFVASGSWFVAFLLQSFLLPALAGKFQITQITFDADADPVTNKYTKLYISYTVLEDIYPVYQNASGATFQGFVRVTVPTTMSLHDHTVTPVYLQFPNSPAWSGYRSSNFVTFPPERNVIQALINGSTPLLAGTSDTFIIPDVRVPPNCSNPGIYTFQISDAIATYRPVHRGVLCPELTHLQVSFDQPWYDSVGATLTLTAMVGYWDLIVPAQDGVPAPVQLLFPQQTTPNTFVLNSSSSVLEVASFVNGTSVVAYWPPNGTHNVTSVPASPAGVVAQPSIARYYNPAPHTVVVGTLISLNVTLVDLPWDCTPNQTFCVTVSFFTGCGVIPAPVIGCPVFSGLDIDFFPSLYSSPQSTLRLGLQILDPTQPLFAKSKYKVVVTFPANQGYGIANAGIQAAPLGSVTGSGPQAFGFSTPARTASTVECYLSGASNTGTWNIGDVYLTTYGYFNVSNVSLPQNCWQLGNWTLQIGPWAVQSAPAYKVTGCATLSNLSVQFSPPYQGSAGGSAVISFDVTKYPLPLEPLFLTLPYYSGTAQTFNVWSSAADLAHFQVDGIANPTLTVYKGVTYHFSVNSYLAFALLSDANTLYLAGVTVNGIAPVAALTSGAVDWAVPLGAGPASILYGTPTTGPYGTILIAERPRGVVVDTTSFVSDSGVAKASQGVYGEAFQTWQALDVPAVTVQSDGLGNANYTYSVFQSLAAGAQPVPMGRLSFTLRNVALPADCSPLAPVAIRFGPWGTNATLPGVINCPQLVGLQVKLSTNVRNEQGVVAYFTFQLSSAPLLPAAVRALFPPTAGFTFSSPLIQAFSWSGSAPSTTVYPAVEVSVLQAFAAGSPAAPGQNVTVAVYGVTNPSNCSDLGAFSLRVGQWRGDTAPSDRILCPVLSGLDVRFTPTANQSAITNASITFTTSDSIDPRFIQVLVPDRVGTAQARLTYAMGWTLGGMTRAGNLLTTDIVGGPRLPAGTYTLTLANVRLPRGNCSDLGNWSLQIGTSLNITANPVSDVVQNCVTLSNLTVTFSPDGEQGQLVNMTVAFTISQYPLYFVPGDSDWLTVMPSAVSGVQFTISSTALDGLGGSWRVIPSEPTENRTFLYQALSAGTTLPVGTRTGFTVTNVLLPTGCPAPGLWEVAVGIWKVRQTPPANGSLTLCPVLSGLEVSYTPNVPGSENVTALVNFTVEVVRLRPQPGWLRLNFPAASDITFQEGVTLVGLADWSPLSPILVVNPHVHDGSQQTTYAEIELIQAFRGSPLEPGKYSFWVRGINLPDNNCNNLGLYRLAVGNWSSPWTDPQLDTLTCRGLVSPINVTVSPAGLTRLATGASYTFDFVVPDCRYNQIEVTFPADFALSSSSSRLTAYSGFDPSTSTVTVPAANKFVIQSINQTCYQTPALPSEAYRRVRLTVNNVQVGNSCDGGVFSITTRTCGYFDRSVGLASPVWMCVPADGDATGTVSTQTAMPTGCGLCNACRYQFQDPVRGGGIYKCNQNGIQFQRSSLSFSGMCSEHETTTPQLW